MFSIRRPSRSSSNQIDLLGIDRRLGAQPGEHRERLLGATIERIVAAIPGEAATARLSEGEGDDTATEMALRLGGK